MQHPDPERSVMVRSVRRALTGALLFGAVAACAEPLQPSSAARGLPLADRGGSAMDDDIPVAHIILPSETGEATEIDWVPRTNPATARHYVWLPAQHVPRAGLFVFMPGTGNQPINYRLFSAAAAGRGYHVIGLMYQNDRGVDALCKGIKDQCAENARMEILTGDPLSDLVTVSKGNSIEHRLERVLLHLATEYPGEGWDEFLVDGSPAWSRIAFGGQSQGAGQAALIARERKVRRVVMLSGPPDQANAPAVDSWVRVGETERDRMYALYHFNDLLAAGITTNVTAFGLDQLGTVGVGTAGPWCETADTRELTDRKFGDAHVLVTNLVPNGGCVGLNGGNPHRSTARDEFTPLLEDGTPALLHAWRYLIGDPGDRDDKEEGDDAGGR